MQIFTFLNISPSGCSDLQRTLNHLDHPMSVYSMLKTIYLFIIYKYFGLYIHDFYWDNVQHFGPLKTYLLSGSDREIFS